MYPPRNPRITMLDIVGPPTRKERVFEIVTIIYCISALPCALLLTHLEYLPLK